MEFALADTFVTLQTFSCEKYAQVSVYSGQHSCAKTALNEKIPVFPESLSFESAFNHDRMFFGDLIHRFLFRNIQFQYAILELRGDVCFSDLFTDIEASLHHS